MAGAFISSRMPLPPPPLATWMGGVELADGPVTGSLLAAGLGELDAARTTPGRVRSSAFHLLAADALITYACEAALDEADPRRHLVEILRQAAAPRP
jgi:hypothetical protein